MSEAVPDPQDAAIIIVGAGPVGLSLALDLGRRNLPCLVLDGEPTQTGPKANKRANAINARSMEYLRRIGAAGAVRAAVKGCPALTLDVAFVTSLTGYELARFVNAFESSPEPPHPDLSPEQYLRIDQDEIIAILRREIAGTPSIRILAGSVFEDLEETEKGVLVTARQLADGHELTLRCAYLIGCDGGTSTVRKKAGLKLDGVGAQSPNLNVTFVSEELERACVHEVASMYWVVSPDVDGFVGGNGRTWRMTIWNTHPERDAAVRSDPGRFIAAMAGRPVAHEVVSIDSWQAHHLVAQRYGTPRVFLAGDAAHMHPPTGGLGMNTGLGDAANLGWKLAAVLQGWGGPRLLASYDAERRPLGARVVAQANHQYTLPPGSFLRPFLDRDDPSGQEARAAAHQDIIDRKRTEFFSRGLVLGHTYSASPVIAAEPAPVLNTDVVTLTETAQPGIRLPHRLVDGRSLYDRLDPVGLSLLVFGEPSEAASTVSLAAAAGIPLTVVAMPSDLLGIYGARFLIVRPDQHVAWRGDEAIRKADLLKLVGAEQVKAAAGTAGHPLQAKST